MYIPYKVVEVIHKERVDSLLAQSKQRRNRNRLPIYQRLQAFIGSIVNRVVGTLEQAKPEVQPQQPEFKQKPVSSVR